MWKFCGETTTLVLLLGERAETSERGKSVEEEEKFMNGWDRGVGEHALMQVGGKRRRGSGAFWTVTGARGWTQEILLTSDIESIRGFSPFCFVVVAVFMMLRKEKAMHDTFFTMMKTLLSWLRDVLHERVVAVCVRACVRVCVCRYYMCMQCKARHAGRSCQMGCC
jgi:hypothetical protein